MHVLALPFGHSVAHTSRLLEIARALRGRGHTVAFAGGGEVMRIAGDDGFPLYDLPEESLATIVRAVRTTNFGLLYGDPDWLYAQVRAELALYERLSPDVVLADDRRTARVSAALAGLPHAAVVNAHVTNHSRYPLLLPRYRRRHPNRPQRPAPRLLLRALLAVERRFFHAALGGFVRLHRRLGLTPAYAYDIAAGNDLTLVADVPEFTPLDRPPPTMHVVGPITWQSGLPAPDSIEFFLAAPRRVLFSVGSGGIEELARRLAAAPSGGCAYMVAAGEQVDAVRAAVRAPHVFVERYVNADLLLPHCDAIVCHGGNGTVYQALRYGVPVVSVPTHNEQGYNARRAEQLGLGLMVDARAALRDFGAVLRALDVVVREPGYRANAGRFQCRLAPWDGPTRAADLIEGLGRGRTPAGRPHPPSADVAVERDRQALAGRIV